MAQVRLVAGSTLDAQPVRRGGARYWSETTLNVSFCG